MITDIPAQVLSRIDALESSICQLADAFQKFSPDGHPRDPDSRAGSRSPSQSNRETIIDLPRRHRPRSPELADRWAELAMVLDLMPQPAAILDPSGMVRVWNRAAEQLLGWPAHQVIGRPPGFLPPAMSVGVIEPMTDSMTVCQCADGGQILIRMSATYTAIGTVITLVEIPPLLCEPLEQSDIANINDPELLRTVTIGQLAAGVAHDVNNLVTIIGGYGQILGEQQAAADPGREMAESIVEMCHQAGEMLHYLTGRSKSAPAPLPRVPVRELFTQLRRMIPRFVGHRHSAFLECHTGDIEIRGESIALLRMVMNLVGNARSAMPKGGRIEVLAREEIVQTPLEGWPDRVSAGRYAVVSVSDQGNGMAPDVMSQLFETHFTTRSQEGGLGLGMGVVAQIVAEAGGFIQITSSPRVGTCVNVYFPVVE